MISPPFESIVIRIQEPGSFERFLFTGCTPSDSRVEAASRDMVSSTMRISWTRSTYVVTEGFHTFTPAVPADTPPSHKLSMI